MTNKKYQTADEAIAEINNRVNTIKSLIPAELLNERYSQLINDNAADAISQIEYDRNSKYPSFDRVVSGFGYGCSLRSVVKKSREIGKLDAKLEQLFNDSVRLQ